MDYGVCKDWQHRHWGFKDRFGYMGDGWMWGGTDEDKALKALLKGLESGINLIDTAPIYGFGKAEEIIGNGRVHGYG
ncbi:MAG: aldo/keto reductase [Thermodesulfovibrionales bacterium]|nr:aldo/keto reductase [Thermodesulfovibrionales bacterium]